MLKSELLVSDDLELLDSYLKNYNMRFLGPFFSDEEGAGKGGLKAERAYVLEMADSSLAEARTYLIPLMMKDRDLLTKVKEIILKIKEWDIDPLIIRNTIGRINALVATIEKHYIATSLHNESITEYYDRSFGLIICFTAIRTQIMTMKKIYSKFHPDNIVCVLKFNHNEDRSFSITQQKKIIEFVEKIFTFFYFLCGLPGYYHGRV